MNIQNRIPAFIAITDSIFVLLDIKFKYLYQIKLLPADCSGLSFWKLEYTNIFPVHLSIYSLFLTVITLLAIKKIFTINYLFRKPYLHLGFTLITLIFLNFFFMFSDIKYDFSFFCYTYLSIVFWYYTYFILEKDKKHYLLSYFTDTLSSAVACFDLDGLCIYSNEQCQKLFKGETKNSTIKNIETYYLNSWFYNSNSPTANGEEKIHIDGTDRIFRVEHQKLYDNKLRFSGSFFKLLDITEEIEKINKAKYRAIYDELTGLYNRTTFFEKVEELCKKEPDVPRYMIVTHIHNFRLLNDLFGSTLGNTVLKKHAELLNTVKPEDTILGRISPEKCAILVRCSDFNEEIALKNTDSIQKITTSLNYRLKIYIGIYEIMHNDESAVSMCDKAILAIREIAGDYEQTISYYNSTMMEGIIMQKEILNEFPRALRSNEIHLYVQPITDKKGNCNKGEILVRWKHPLIGLLSPNYFLSTLENTSYIFAMDSFVWTKAVQTLKKYYDDGKDLSFAVNVSSKDFLYSDLYIVFTDLVEKYNLPPSKLTLQIQEDVLKINPERSIECINSLHEYGFPIEIDHFGKDNSSLKVMGELEIDGIKIDLTEYQELENSDHQKKYFNSIFTFAKNLKLYSAACGIENKQQISKLSKLGCQEFQGYYFDKPIPMTEFENKYMGGKTDE